MRVGAKAEMRKAETLSAKQFIAAQHAEETGGSVSAYVLRCLPTASAEVIRSEINRVYDAMEAAEAGELRSEVRSEEALSLS